MATVLHKNKMVPLNFTSGNILTLEQSPLLLPPAGCRYTLGLCNEKGDILLQIEFSTNGIMLNDRANRSLGDGWGKEQTVDMAQVDLKGRSVLNVTVSIHHYLTESEFGRYQILFNGITIAHFEKRFPGPATQIHYLCRTLRGPISWDVDVFQLDDLLPEERLALWPGRAPLPPIPGLDSMAISIQPSYFIPTQTYAPISWDHGKEIRLYYLGPSNVLHEYAYSVSKGKNSWYYGDLDLLKIVLDPTSSISAIRLEDDDDTICVYYQDPNTDFIRAVNQRGSTKPWKEAPPIAKAVKGSSFAIIRDPTIKRVARIYYQDPELHLRECWYDHLNNTADQGGFNLGVRPRGTPITAEVVQGSVVDINVTWRDSQGRVASGSWSRSSGWDLQDANGVRASLDGRD